MGSVFDYLMWTYGSEIITMIVAVVFGGLGFVAKNLVKTYLNDKRKQDIAKAVVRFVEQCFKDMHGEEKLSAALNRAASIMMEKGIEFNVTEMETLIESAVAEFNEAFKK
jgi:F0F1-type ATP synthase membrane subunit a